MKNKKKNYTATLSLADINISITVKKTTVK